MAANATHRPPPSFGKVIGERQGDSLSAWGNDDIITGLIFCATMQLRTPLRVLLRHGEIHSDKTKPPPRIAMEMWEGIWLPETTTYRELGIDVAEPPPGAHASAIGPIVASEYLPFLIAIRKIVELNDPIESRIDKLRKMLSECGWQEFLGKHEGTEGIVQYFFPRYTRPMPGLPASTLAELFSLGLDTPNRLAAATDEVLLGIKGIGRAKLQAIRAHCADMAKHRDADRVENVIR